MGYTTDFNGSLTINPPLDSDSVKYINAFSNTRRMKRDVSKIAAIDPEGVKGKFGTNDYGTEGEFFVNENGFRGQDDDGSVLDHNSPASTQPGLWCQWVITEDGEALEWDGGEKFYYYVEWLEYVIKNFIAPLGRACNGTITWQGEDSEDTGMIKVEENKVKVGKAKVIYEF